MTKGLALRVGAQQRQSRLIPSRRAMASEKRLIAEGGNSSGIYEGGRCTVSVEDMRE